MLQVITDRLQVYKPIQYNKHTPLNNTAVANRKEWAYFPLLTLQYLLYLIITPLIWDCKGFLKILLNKKRSSLRPFPLSGAEGLEPSARGFGAAVEVSKKLIAMPFLSRFCTLARTLKSFWCFIDAIGKLPLE